MSNNEPYARLEYRLSNLGVLDALRRGFATSENVAHYIDPSDFEWDQLFSLNPETIVSDTGEFIGLRVEVGRRYIYGIAPRSPDIYYLNFSHSNGGYDENFEYSYWTRPQVSVEVQAGRPLDQYLTPAECVKVEQSRLQESEEARDEFEAELESIVLVEWREWVQGDGLVSIGRLVEMASQFVSDNEGLLRTVEQRKLWQSASKHLESLKRRTSDIGNNDETSDDELAVLMGLFEMLADDLEALNEAMDEERRRKAQLDEATYWITRFGSRRLKKVLQLGMLDRSMGVYRDERLKADRPGWGWYTTKHEPTKGLINPTEEALDALIEAQVDDPQAKLGYLPSAGAVVLSSYLDRTIYRTVDEEPF